MPYQQSSAALLRTTTEMVVVDGQGEDSIKNSINFLGLWVSVVRTWRRYCPF